jgi:hypothetical protein
MKKYFLTHYTNLSKTTQFRQQTALSKGINAISMDIMREGGFIIEK